MKPLTKYAKNGYDFTIVKEKDGWAIAKGISRTTGRENWEVIEIQSHNGIMRGNNWVEPCYYPPSNNQWGVKGFTAVTQEQAEQILNRETNQ